MLSRTRLSEDYNKRKEQLSDDYTTQLPGGEFPVGTLIDGIFHSYRIKHLRGGLLIDSKIWSKLKKKDCQWIELLVKNRFGLQRVAFDIPFSKALEQGKEYPMGSGSAVIIPLEAWTPYKIEDNESKTHTAG